MMDSRRIKCNLISCRNMLLEGRATDGVIECMREVVVSAGLVEIGGLGRVVARCVRLALTEIDAGNPIGAGVILNLLHNLPLDGAAKRAWSIDYFLSVELPVFLDRYDEVASARDIVLHVMAELSSQLAVGLDS